MKMLYQVFLHKTLSNFKQLIYKWDFRVKSRFRIFLYAYVKEEEISVDCIHQEAFKEEVEIELKMEV